MREDASGHQRSAQARMDEAVGLAVAIRLDVVGVEAVAVDRPHPGTFLGAGTVDRLKAAVAEAKADLLIFDHALSPVQQRNLERALMCKVVDRTGLILEIFGARARTREGQLQVELAALLYQKSRLVRSWTHLERQRGGFGFLGGPGESQLEIDRRLIGQRILTIQRELHEARQRRALQRQTRRRRAWPLVALAGYTNAGKSTLFNRLTGAQVRAENLLFATLDPTLRAFDLPGGHRALLSDTVGFISDLPTQLVEAFHATLEEVQDADIILHVRDIAHPDSGLQRHDVQQVLAALGIAADSDRVIEVLNKADNLPLDDHRRLNLECDRHNAVASAAADGQTEPGAGMVAVSALSGEGMDRLYALMTNKLFASRHERILTLTADGGATLAWLHRHGQVQSQRVTKTGRLRVRAALDSSDWGRFEKSFPDIPTRAAPAKGH